MSAHQSLAARRYVVGVDGSGPSSAALEWVVERLSREPGPVVLVFVHSDGSDGSDGAHPALAAQKNADALLAKARESVLVERPEADVTSRQLSGDVASAIAEFVELDDLLVIGTHKTGFLHGRVLGSLGVRIATVAPCSITVVPEASTRFRSGVVAGIDHAVSGRDIARTAAREARNLGSDLLLLHTPATADVADRFASAWVFERTVTVRSRLSQRALAEALLDAARDKSLLLLGTPRLGEAPAALDAVVHDVLMNLTAPVMIVRYACAPLNDDPTTPHTRKTVMNTAQDESQPRLAGGGDQK